MRLPIYAAQARCGKIDGFAQPTIDGGVPPAPPVPAVVVEPVPSPPKPVAAGGFHSGDCNLVTDDEVKKAVTGSVAFNKVVDGEEAV